MQPKPCEKRHTYPPWHPSDSHLSEHWNVSATHLVEASSGLPEDEGDEPSDPVENADNVPLHVTSPDIQKGCSSLHSQCFPQPFRIHQSFYHVQDSIRIGHRRLALLWHPRCS